MISCPRCPARWTGVNRAHCSKCHMTMGGITAFDQHRKGNKCVHPSKLGLHDNGKAVWVTDYQGPSDE